jgi:hypothetical protein
MATQVASQMAARALVTGYPHRFLPQVKALRGAAAASRTERT